MKWYSTWKFVFQDLNGFPNNYILKFFYMIYMFFPNNPNSRAKLWRWSRGSIWQGQKAGRRHHISFGRRRCQPDVSAVRPPRPNCPSKLTRGGHWGKGIQNEGPRRRKQRTTIRRRLSGTDCDKWRRRAARSSCRRRSRRRCPCCRCGPAGKSKWR